MTRWYRLPQALDRLSTKSLLLFLTACFVLTRGLFWAVGVRFDAAPLGGYWQYLDPLLLQSELLRSLFYLHSQPPLFNLFLGLVIKAFPSSSTTAFHVIFLLCGLFCYLTTFFLMNRLGVSRSIAWLVSTLVVCRPSFILFENWLMYDVPVTALVCVSALGLAYFFDNSERSLVVSPMKCGHLFFTTLAILCLTRSLFHLVFFAGTIALLCTIAPTSRRRILKAAALPFSIVVLVYLKGFVVFGHLGPSTWVGMNFARIATASFAEPELQRLYEEGHLSVLATIPPFSPPTEYPEDVFLESSHSGVPALDHRRKSTGSVNFNHQSYIDISRGYFRDAVWIVTHQPGAYLEGVAKAWYNYTKPQTELTHVSPNNRRLATYSSWGEGLLHGRLRGAFEYQGSQRALYLFSTLGIPLLTLYAVFLARRRPEETFDTGSRVLLAFMAFTISYVALVGNSLEVWENQRFRFYTDPFFAIIFAVAVERLLGGKRNRQPVGRPNTR